MGFTLVEIRGLWADAGVPAHGHVTFRRSQSLQDPATNVVSPNDERRVRLSDLGAISIVLEATDDPGVVPSGTTYLVTEVINRARRSYSITVPAAAASIGIELADVAPAIPGPAMLQYALQVTLDTE